MDISYCYLFAMIVSLIGFTVDLTMYIDIEYKPLVTTMGLWLIGFVVFLLLYLGRCGYAIY